MNESTKAYLTGMLETLKSAAESCAPSELPAITDSMLKICDYLRLIYP